MSTIYITPAQSTGVYVLLVIFSNVILFLLLLLLLLTILILFSILLNYKALRKKKYRVNLKKRTEPILRCNCEICPTETTKKMKLNFEKFSI